ncbi:MAG: peptide ABC transporter substrate-binding protein [Candidatus Eisenbacteria bacterium]|nr:peptide ABC transporter substrate-binding protein [Candidatus Eisenbacteria bacterium]
MIVALLLIAAGLTEGAFAAKDGRKYFGSIRPPTKNILSYSNGAEPEMVDPGLSVGQPDGNICRLQWEGLTIEHAKTLEPLPGMAERWELSADGLTYTFHLRQARWSDGNPVTALDFLYAWRRVLTAANTARYAGIFYYIRNAEGFHKGLITDPDQIGIQAPDDSTLIVTLNNPTPYFLSLTSFYSFMPVPRWCVEKFGVRWSRPENVVVNGPFRCTSWKPNNRFLFDKNPTYWDQANVKLDGIVAYSIDDLNTILNLYKAGTTDWNPSGYLPAQYLPYVKDMADFRTAPYLGVYFYSFNVTNEVMKNKWLRKALAWSIDREAICRQLFKGMRIPHANFVAQGFEGYPYPKVIGFDPAYARECLAKAGYPDGKGLAGLELMFNTSEDHRKLAEIVQAMWKDHLKINVALSNQEWGSYLRNTTGLNYQVARRSWIGDYADPATFLDCMKTGDGNNRTGWSSPEYDALLAEAGRTFDPVARYEILARAETLLLDECPVIPIYNYTLTEMIKPYVRGIEANLTNTNNLKFAWIDRNWSRDAAP